MSERSGVETLMAPAIRGVWGRAGRGVKACVAVGALVAVLAGAVVSPPVAGQEATGDDVEVRIVARKLESGRIEFGLQQRDSDDAWGDRRLPRVRFFPTTAGVGRWLASSPLDLPVGEVRIVARKLTDGRIEFGLQQRDSDDTWGDRRLPRVRFFPTTAGVGRWLASSPLTLTAAGPGTESPTTTDQPSAGQHTTISAGGSSGGGHNCGLREDGTIACWGANSVGQSDAPPGLFKAVTAGGFHSCGLREDDTVICWGAKYREQTDAPAGSFTTVNAGGDHSCGLREDSTVTYWGYNEDGQSDAPAGTFGAVDAGNQHTCGLRSDDTVTCWGSNLYGQTDAPSGRFKAVSVGGNHSCGLREDEHRDLLGMERVRADRRARGHVQVGHCRRIAYLRAAQRRQCDVLGRQRIQGRLWRIHGAGRRARRQLQGCRRRRSAHLRGA